MSDGTPFDQTVLDRFPVKQVRPKSELKELEKIWCAPKGWQLLTAVSNNYIGFYYIATAFLFFLLAGILSLLMRVQLAGPAQAFLSPEVYNQVFTMHGTVMMFLFAVPAVEAAGVMLLPQMIGARDLPFPRLSAYAYWIYLIGGLFFFASLLVGLAPDGGWFMYPPLTGRIYSPGINADFWLLGIGFIEISAIAGAIEFVVGILRTRAPGMSLDKMPVFAWALLVFSMMILVAFPSVILCTLLLELERALNWPFFDATRGGDPLLWQHLFWFFGHPEVYIIFLPAAAMLTHVICTTARSDLIGYPLVVLGILATGVISLGVWAHHMFTTGIPDISLGLFSAASTAVSIPAGILVFSWIATLASGKPKLHVPGLFAIGSIVIFVAGGLTGVMLAMVPFNLQAHDSYFVVAHLHYVLLGGMVFPLFAAFYYWIPAVSAHALSERLGVWVFWLMFIGTHVTFLPMHITGLRGLPRRVYTYLPVQEVSILNLVSTLGAFIVAVGILLFIFDLVRNFRFRPGEGTAGNVYGGGTMEWLQTGLYSTRSIPVVRSRQPLWDDPKLHEDVEKGRYFLPRSATGRRETILTSSVEALPQQLLIIPGPSAKPIIAGVFTSGFFVLLTVQAYGAAVASGILSVVVMLAWLWDTDRPLSQREADIGAGIMVPTSAVGRMNHGVWAMLCLLLVLGMMLVMALFSLAFLRTNQPQFWIQGPQFFDSLWVFATAGMALFSAVAARQVLSTRHGALMSAAMVVVCSVFLVISLFLDWRSWTGIGLDPQWSGQGAIIFGLLAHQASLLLVTVLMAGYLVVRAARGLVTQPRSVALDLVVMFLVFAAVQALVMAMATRIVSGGA